MRNFEGSTKTNGARCTSEIKSGIAMAKAAINEMIVSTKLYLNLRQKLIKYTL
jgi:hypothetical protein